jgi:hypothetical protein
MTYQPPANILPTPLPTYPPNTPMGVGRPPPTGVLGRVGTSISERPIFIVHLQPQPGVDPVRALRAFLKVALRRFGLKAIDVRQSSKDEP